MSFKEYLLEEWADALAKLEALHVNHILDEKFFIHFYFQDLKSAYEKYAHPTLFLLEFRPNHPEYLRSWFRRVYRPLSGENSEMWISRLTTLEHNPFLRTLWECAVNIDTVLFYVPNVPDVPDSTNEWPQGL